MSFKILDHNANDISYIEGKQEKYINNVKLLEKRYNIKLPDIKAVHIGNSSYPITKIIFADGLELLAEESTVFWLDDDNEKRITEYKKLNNI